MPIVSDEDIQVQLPADKLRVEAIPDDLEAVKEDAERVIRGTLATAFSSTLLASWITPETTPSQIRAVAGRLCAALIYRVRYSEDDLDDPEFAQVKYNEAMNMLAQILSGDIILDDVDEVTGTQFDNTFFWPNDTTDPPIFTVTSRF